MSKSPRRPTPTKAPFVADVLRRLERQHGRRPFAPRGRPLDVLVQQMLAQNTSGGNAAEGYRRLKRDLPTWRAVLDAPVEDVERAIGVCGLGRMRAIRLKAILARVVRERGRPTLAFVGRLPVGDARDYLMSFHGIGPKTVACTLLFAFGFPVFPVDKGVTRVARRLRIVGPTAGEEKVVATVERATADRPDRRHALHVLMYRHAKLVCRPRNPQCDECRLLAVCPHGRRRARRDAPPERIDRPARRISAGLPKGDAER